MSVQHIVLALIIVALLVAVGGRSSCLPGDIYYQGKQFTVSFPIMTCIVVSIIVAILFRLFGLGGGK